MRTLLLAALLTACAQPRYVDEEVATAAARGVGCFRDPEVCVDLTWEKKPTEDDFGSFTFDTRKGNEPADPALAPSVLLWMPSMGHGSSPVTVERLGTGHYRASRVFFTMKGEWQIRFQQKRGAEVEDEVVVPFVF